MNFWEGKRPARRLFHYPLSIIHYLTILSPFPR